MWFYLHRKLSMSQYFQTAINLNKILKMTLKLKRYMCSILTKGSTCRKNKKNDIFLDLNRAGHDKYV